MRTSKISGRQQFRGGLEQHVETVKILIEQARAQGRNPRDLQTVGAHLFAALKTMDHRGPVEAESVRITGDPNAAASTLITAVFAAAGVMQEAIATTEILSLKDEAFALRPDLVELAGRLAAVDHAFRIVADATVKTHVLVTPSAGAF
jgi:hypothetical protein